MVPATLLLRLLLDLAPPPPLALFFLDNPNSLSILPLSIPVHAVQQADTYSHYLCTELVHPCALSKMFLEPRLGPLEAAFERIADMRVRHVGPTPEAVRRPLVVVAHSGGDAQAGKDREHRRFVAVKGEVFCLRGHTPMEGRRGNTDRGTEEQGQRVGNRRGTSGPIKEGVTGKEGRCRRQGRGGDSPSEQTSMNGLAISVHAAGLGPPGWKQTQASTGLVSFASKTLRVPPKQYLSESAPQSKWNFSSSRWAPNL